MSRSRAKPEEPTVKRLVTTTTVHTVEVPGKIIENLLREKFGSPDSIVKWICAGHYEEPTVESVEITTTKRDESYAP